MDNIKEYILINNFGDIIENATFKELTTFGIGGSIKYLYIANSISSLIKVYKYILDKKIHYFVIGNGSNILVDDKYFNGVVISLKRLNKYKIRDNILEIEAGATYIDLVYLLKNNIGGFEALATIPASIGGMLYNNAGCFKKEIGDIVIEVTFIDLNGVIKTLKKDELKFSYRYSIFKEQKCIILSAKLNILDKSDYEYYKLLMNKRRLKQPINKKNAGSTFKNTFDISVWQIIDKINLRGFNINDAYVSCKHANFLINNGKSSFNDMYKLINLIKQKALLINYNLELEIEIISFE